MLSLWQVLLHAAQAEDGESLSCQECIILLDTAADLLAEGLPSQEVMPIVRKHLNRCPACTQEYQQALAALNPHEQA